MYLECKGTMGSPWIGLVLKTTTINCVGNARDNTITTVRTVPKKRYYSAKEMLRQCQRNITTVQKKKSIEICRLSQDKLVCELHLSPRRVLFECSLLFRTFFSLFVKALNDLNVSFTPNFSDVSYSKHALSRKHELLFL